MARADDQARELARALEGDAEASTEIASLVSLARMIEDLPQPQIDLSFAQALEAKLLAGALAPAAAVPASIPAPAPIATRPAAAAAVPAGIVIRLDAHRRRMRRSLTAAIAAAMLLALPVAASANAAPGTGLYGARLARENARVWGACRVDAIRCGFAHMDVAGERLQDLRLVIAREQTRLVPPTARRLGRALTKGTTTILAARPPQRTLRRLAVRLDRASTDLQMLVGAVPPDVMGVIQMAIASRDALALRVRVALGEVTTEPSDQPPVAIGPPFKIERPDPPAGPKEPADQAPAPKDRTPRPPTGGNNFGPGGTATIQKPKPGETWTNEKTVIDQCPVAAVSAPGVNEICSATPRSKRR